ncbi:MAG: bacteriohemerythrin [Bryobacteraceae bacterium]|jgi:hemerythrin-like metal-binding protein
MPADYMPWREEYSVEVISIDAQHKHLVSLINGMTLVLQRGSQSHEVVALLEDLLEYTRSHFAFEERMMAQAGYLGLAAHRKKHAAMQSEVGRMLAEAKAGNVMVPLKLMPFLRGWLAKHIMGTDKSYVPALKKAGIA